MSTLFELAVQQGYVVSQMAPRVGRYQSYRIEIDPETRARVYHAFKATHVDGVDSPFFSYVIPERSRVESQDMWKERVAYDLKVLWQRYEASQAEFRKSLVPQKEIPSGEIEKQEQIPDAPAGKESPLLIGEADVPDAPSPKRGRGRPRKDAA